MKKYLLLLAAFGLFFFNSCSNDDDGGSTDPILGTWILVDASLFDVNACEENSIVTFNAGNTGSGTFYVPAADCAAQNSPGNWANLGNSRYSIAVPVFGNVEGTVNFTTENDFIFQTETAGSFTFEKQ